MTFLVANDTGHTVVVMFNETTTELIKCSADSLMDAVDETAGDDSGLPTAIRNVIGTTHVMEIKTQSYYEYRTHESFTCWRRDLVDAVDDRASSSSRLISADDSEPSFKRPTKKPYVSTPSKPNEDVSRKRHRSHQLSRMRTTASSLWTRRKGRCALMKIPNDHLFTCLGRTGTTSMVGAHKPVGARIHSQANNEAMSINPVPGSNWTAGDDAGVPTAIRNVIGTTHVMEIKTQSYYDYGTHERFTCWRLDLVDAVDDGASSSS
ncbi:DNA helicase PIF1, ATP-dependent [Tanacetum coccineum]